MNFNLDSIRKQQEEELKKQQEQQFKFNISDIRKNPNMYEKTTAMSNTPTFGSTRVNENSTLYTPEPTLFQKIGGTAGDVATNIGRGFLQTTEGIVDLGRYGVAGVADLFGADEYAQDVRERAKEDTTSFLLQPAESAYNPTSTLKEDGIIEGVAQGVGQIGAFVGGGALLGGASKTASAGKALTGTAAKNNVLKNAVTKIGTLVKQPTTAVVFTSSVGNGYTTALNDGATDGEALAYGVLSGLKETGTELMYGGLGKAFGVGALDEAVGKALTKSIKNSVARNTVKLGVNMTAEGLEEVASGLLEPFVASVYKKELDFSSYETLLDEFIIGALTSGAVSAPGLAGQVSIDNQNQQRLEQVEQEVQKIAPLPTSQTLNQMTIPKQSLQDVVLPSSIQQTVMEKPQTDNVQINEFRQSAQQNNVNLDSGFMDSVEKVIQDRGVSVNFDNTLDSNVNGQIQTVDGKTTITINPNSQRAGEFVIMHELTHSLETDVMKNLVMDYASKQPQFAEALKSLQQTYKTNEVSDEVLADISGQLFGNQEFINNLSTQQPSVFKKVYDAIISFANKITGNSNQALFMRDLKNKWQNAYRNQNNQVEGAKLSQQENNFEVKESRMYGYHHNQSDNIIETLNKNGEVIGTLDYNVYDDVVNINMIEIKPEYRKMGIATEMMNQLKQDNPGLEIQEGYSTPEGTAFLNEYNKPKLTEEEFYAKFDPKKETQAVDNQGNTLSKQQQEYFKDSKIRDENGNLQIVYHGTNADFTVFDKSKIGNQTDKGMYGRGFYFSKTQSPYGNRNIEVYLDIKNPFMWHNYKMEELAKILGMDSSWFSVNEVNGNVRLTAKGSETFNITSTLKRLNYDGVINEISDKWTEFVAFEPNQIKNIDNINPTTNEDIRYSQQSGKWQEFVESNFKATGTRTQLAPIDTPQLTNKNGLLPSTKTSQPSTIDKDGTVVVKETKSEISKQKVSEEQEQQIAKVLDALPQKEKTGLKKSVNKFYQEIVSNHKPIEDLSKKLNRPDLLWSFDNSLQAQSVAMNVIEKYQSDINGKNIGKSVTEMRDTVLNSGKIAEFSDYMVQRLNVDRNAQDKTATGQTTEQSQELITKYDKENPQFKEWANDIYNFYQNELKLSVDSGFITQETANLFNEMYPNYIRIQRDIDSGASNVMLPTGIKVRNPIKKAKGGTQDILPIFDTMALYAIQNRTAIANNSFGNILYDIVGGTEVESYNNVYDDENYTFTIFRDGQPYTMKLNEEMFKAVKGNQRYDIEDAVVFRAAQKASQMFRGGITEYNPFFLVRNFIKDVNDAPINSKYSVGTYVKNLPKAIYNMKNNSEMWQQYLALGGFQNSDFNKQTGLALPTKNVGKKFVKKIVQANFYVEQVSRFTEFISTIENGGTLSQAMYNAAEITTNFKRGGNVTKALNRNGFTFLNASVQGFDKFFRNFSEQKGAKAYVNLATKMFLAGVLPSMLNEMLLGDDEDYQELSEYVKEGYYLFKTGDGTFLRIPKGRMASVLYETADSVLSYPSDKDSFEGLLQFAVDTIGPMNPIESNILAPLISATANTTWYGGDIVPYNLQDFPTEYQYDSSTSDISKAIGNFIGASPMKVDYVLDQYTGIFGDLLLPATRKESNENILSSQFTANTVNDSKYVGEFYDALSEAIKETKVNPTDEEILLGKYMSTKSSDISELSKQQREIQESDLSKSEKQKQVNIIQDQKNEISKIAVEDSQDIFKQSNYAIIGDIEYYKNSKGEWTKLSNDNLNDLQNAENAGFDANNYLKLKNELSGLDKNTFINELIDYSGTNSEKAYMYSKYYSSPEKLDNLVNSNIKIDEYLKLESMGIEGIKDSSGNTISGTRKTNYISAVNGLNLTIPQKAILIKQEYESFDDYNSQIISYVNGLDLTIDDKTNILTGLGFSVEGGYIKW